MERKLGFGFMRLPLLEKRKTKSCWNYSSYFELYNKQSQFGDSSNSKNKYAEMKGCGKAKDCIECGVCERECPQHIEIRKHIKEVSELFD